MFKKSCTIFLFFVCSASIAEPLDLTSALQNTYRNCVGIDENLHDLKVLAGINTAVSAVGTGLGVGATATGLAKYKTDKEIDEMESYLAELNAAAKEQSEQLTRINVTDEQINALFADYDYDSTDSQELERLNSKSKKLGNWRTGLMVGGTATSIASAVIASKSKADQDLQSQINKCVESVHDLNDSILAAKVNGEDISEAKEIYNACREYEFVDVSPINKRADATMVASSVGAVVGGVGAITSGMANSEKIRNNNTDAGKQKEKNLNKTSNVLAAGLTAASATATVFSATQIAAIKKVAKVSEFCTGALK